MLMDSDTLKKEIESRLTFLDKTGESSFKDGYVLGLLQLKEWIEHVEQCFEEFKNGMNGY